MNKVSEHDPAAHRPGEPDPAAESSEAPAADADAPPARRDDGPVRRSLIRATLPPAAGVPSTPREPPVFTMHQQTRGGAGSGRGNFRSRPGRPDRADGYSGQVNGNKAPRPGQRNERSGQHRFGSTSRPAASRRGRGRSR